MAKTAHIPAPLVRLDSMRMFSARQYLVTPSRLNYRFSLNDVQARGLGSKFRMPKMRKQELSNTVDWFIVGLPYYPDPSANCSGKSYMFQEREIEFKKILRSCLDSCDRDYRIICQPTFGFSHSAQNVALVSTYLSNPDQYPALGKVKKH